MNVPDQPAAPFRAVLAKVIHQHGFLLGMGVAIVLAMLAPRLGSPDGTLHAGQWSWLLVPTMFFISGLLLRTHEIWSAASDWRLHLLIQTFNLVVLPLVFWAFAALALLAGLSPPLCTGLIVLGALSTTTTTGVVFTRAAGGDEAGALFNATLGSLLGLVVTPVFILCTTGHGGHLPIFDVIAKLMLQVLAPIIVGQVVQAFIRPIIEKTRKPLARTTLFLLLVLIWQIFCTSLEHGLAVSGWQVVVLMACVLFLHLLAIFGIFRISAWPLWRLSRPRRTAAVICATQKTAALGLPLLLVVFPGDPALGLIAMPLLIYHPLQLIVASITVPWWQHWNAAASPTAAPSAHAR